MLIIGQTAYKIRYKNLCIRFGTWKVRRLIIDADDKSIIVELSLETSS